LDTIRNTLVYDPCVWTLLETPSDPQLLSVIVNGQSIPRGPNTWAYVPGPPPQVVFASAGSICTQLKNSSPTSPVTVEFRILQAPWRGVVESRVRLHMPRALAFLTAALAWAAGIAGCATTKLTYSPSELRAELARTAPKIPPEEIVIPHEVDERTIALTRSLIRYAKSDMDRVRIISEAFKDPEIFGMRYAPTMTTDAKQAL